MHVDAPGRWLVGRVSPSRVLSARAATDPGATTGRSSAAGAGASGPATRAAASVEQPDAAGLSRLPAARAAPAALAAAEQLVQDGGHVSRLRVLDVVDEGLPAGTLVGRDVEHHQPAVDLDERSGIDREYDDGVQALQRHH